MWQGGVCGGGMSGRGNMHGGACLGRQVCLEGQVWQGACMAGVVCMAGGMCSAGVCVQERRPLKWAVRILLECILVFIRFSRVVLKTHTVFSFIV